MPYWDEIDFHQPLTELGMAVTRKVPPTPVAEPRLVAWNTDLAEQLGLPAELADDPDTALVLGGNRIPARVEPIATAYAGHQFGVFAGQLGDGRALLLGEIDTPGGVRAELQLKGAGETPFSRMGDGRAVLRSTIREYLCSEAMHGLGIPTTRALAIVASPQPVWRETMETAAVLTRVAESHLRFGHFEQQFYRRQYAQLHELADYAIDRYFPTCRAAGNPYQAMLETVIERTAELIAQWQGVGFCHGVMNSDNMSLLGLTIDYGPYGFLDGCNLGHICNHSDEAGRYAYDQQPEAALFNLQCLAQALLPLLERDEAVAALQGYQPRYEAALERVFRAKLGLASEREGDWELTLRLLELMQGSGSDWTLTWRRLAEFDQENPAAPLRDLFLDRPGFDAWAEDYRARLAWENSLTPERAAAMRRVNPKYILRNYLAEQAIRAAQQGDFSEISRLQQLLKRPFDEQPEYEAYTALPPDWAAQIEVSCSS
ncbi:protein adenylyltransferase SelO [Chitinimonas lacunae]|uniref:Protein nucleotidyltransferase YdiU n=1 Tax=Chitinimonas lacunae TaxID=1963018 RepID=A0ABV8MP98_9NEIS